VLYKVKFEVVSECCIAVGYVPTTQLYRSTGRVKRLFNVACFHYVLRCFRLTKNVREAALQIVNLAVSEKYEGKHFASS